MDFVYKRQINHYSTPIQNVMSLKLEQNSDSY